MAPNKLLILKSISTYSNLSMIYKLGILAFRISSFTSNRINGLLDFFNIFEISCNNIDSSTYESVNMVKSTSEFLKPKPLQNDP